MPTTIRPLTPGDRDAALAVINEAARWYREFLPPGEYHEPEMTPPPVEAKHKPVAAPPVASSRPAVDADFDAEIMEIFIEDARDVLPLQAGGGADRMMS